ncbi:hypothetical protein SDC9_20243 [bioreactor metagenome]|uniref:Uncharacterized protein n=1 Tax=bioreactor metagenome TaxID=1076179 RepID=A0A644U608_9ZZZZ
MELKEFTSNRVSRFTQPSISLYRSNGEVRFSPQLVEKLNIQPDSWIQFFQDVYNPNDWYMKVNCSRGFKITVKGNDKRLSITSKALVMAIISSLNIKPEFKPVIPVSTERDLTNDTYALITSTMR